MRAELLLLHAKVEAAEAVGNHLHDSRTVAGHNIKCDVASHKTAVHRYARALDVQAACFVWKGACHVALGQHADRTAVILQRDAAAT